MAETKDWAKLTIPLLKQELASRNLDVKGKKQDLVARLELSSHGKNLKFIYLILLSSFHLYSKSISFGL